MANYCEALREVSAVTKRRVRGIRYLYTNSSNPLRAGWTSAVAGLCDVILSMLEDDITHPSDLTGL